MSRSLEGVLIKRPHQKESYTIQQIKEFASCADPQSGALHFLSNYFYVQHATRGRIKYQPYEYQLRLINTYHTNRFSINMLPRQMGKTATAAGYLLWYAMFIPDSTILIAAHKYQGAQEIMQKIRYAYEFCPDHIRAGAVSYNKGSIEFDNGSRIVSQTTTENTGRGMAISILYCDEFSFVRPSIAEEFWSSISPTLATGGKAIVTSTPSSDEDQFAQIWHGANDCFDEYGNKTELGKNGFKAFRAWWNEHPDRDEKWAAEERARLGEEKFRREMECEFIQDDETLINPLMLVNMQGVEPIEKQGKVRWYKKPDKNLTYLVGLDPSIGTGGDPAAIQVVELPTLIQIGEWQHNKTPVEGQIKTLREITEYLVNAGVVNENIYYSIENNTVGEAGLVSIREAGEENIHGIFLSETKAISKVRKFRKGFTTTNSSKMAACAKFKNLVESRKLTIYSQKLVSELKDFVASGAGYEAKIGRTDDLVTAMLLVIRMMQVVQEFSLELDMKIRDLDVDDIVMPLPVIMSIGR